MRKRRRLLIADDHEASGGVPVHRRYAGSHASADVRNGAGGPQTGTLLLRWYEDSGRPPGHRPAGRVADHQPLATPPNGSMIRAGVLSLQACAGNRAVNELMSHFAVQRCAGRTCDCDRHEQQSDRHSSLVGQRTAASTESAELAVDPDLRVEPTPGHRYQIRKGDTLFEVTSRAYVVAPGAERLKLARTINAHPDNLRFHTADLSENERKLFGGSRISFLPRFGGAPGSSGFAIITIPDTATPAGPTEEPVGPLEPLVCPELPNPLGLWTVEPSLHAIRKEPKYSNKHLLAPGARGMSVKLVHKVLQNWTCQMTEQGAPPAHRLPDWESDDYTQATGAVVRDFQRHFGAEMVEGIVGPETIALLDDFVGFDPSTPCVDELRDWHAAATKSNDAERDRTMAQNLHHHWEQVRHASCDVPLPPEVDPTMITGSSCEVATAEAADAKEKLEEATQRAAESWEEFKAMHEKLMACGGVLTPGEKRRARHLQRGARVPDGTLV